LIYCLQIIQEKNLKAYKLERKEYNYFYLQIAWCHIFYLIPCNNNQEGTERNTTASLFHVNFLSFTTLKHFVSFIVLLTKKERKYFYVKVCEDKSWNLYLHGKQIWSKESFIFWIYLSQQPVLTQVSKICLVLQISKICTELNWGEKGEMKSFILSTIVASNHMICSFIWCSFS
jgi:hypothetical protein